jgi:hypothetical protein
MRYGCFALFGGVAIVAAAAVAPLAGQAPRAAESLSAPTTSGTPARTAWGDPDLQGIWRGLTTVELERPKEFAGREFLTDAELAAKEQNAEDFNARLVAGTVQILSAATPSHPTGIPLRNGAWIISDGRGMESRPSRRTAAIIDPPDGRLPPWTPEQVKRWEAREAVKIARGEADSWEDRSPTERCIVVVDAAQVGNSGLANYGPHRNTGRKIVNNPNALTRDASTGASPGPTKRILQAPGYVVMVMEEGDARPPRSHRVIPLDGRPALGSKIRQWSGDARGHWEGNTLVVEITNINDQQNGGAIIPSQGGALYPGSGTTLRVIERYTRVDADTLEYRYTIDDPKTYTRPYTVLHELTRDDGYKMSPWQCHENNEGLAGILTAGRSDEQAGLAATAADARERKRRLEELKADWAERNKSR